MANCPVCDAEVAPPGNYCADCGTDLSRVDPKKVYEFGKLAAIDDIQSVLLRRLKLFGVPFAVLFFTVSWFGIDKYLEITAEETLKSRFGVSIGELLNKSQRSIDRVNLITVDSVSANVQYKFESTQTRLLLNEVILTLADSTSRAEAFKRGVERPDEASLTDRIALEYEPRSKRNKGIDHSGTRLAAVDFALTYNELLMAILVGESPNRILAYLDLLTEEVDAVQAPELISRLVPLLMKLEQIAGNPQQRADAALELLGQQTAQSIVVPIVTSLRDDARDYYALRAILVTHGRLLELSTAADIYGAMIREVASYRASSTDHDKAVSSFRKKLTEVLPRELKRERVELEFGDSPGLPVFSSAVAARLSVYSIQLEDHIKRSDQLVKNIEAFKDLIDEYLEFLDSIENMTLSLSAQALRRGDALLEGTNASLANHASILWSLSGRLAKANQRMRRALTIYRVERQQL